MKTIDRILQVRAGGAVKRSHVTRQHGINTVAEHTWGVLALVYILFPEEYMELSAHVLFHDVPEYHVGDIPAPVKRYSAEVKEALTGLEAQVCELLQIPNADELNSRQKQVLNACDKLELYFWALEQVQLGNMFASETVAELDNYFHEDPPPQPVGEIINYIKQTDFAQLLPKQAGVMKEMNSDG